MSWISSNPCRGLTREWVWRFLRALTPRRAPPKPPFAASVRPPVRIPLLGPPTVGKVDLDPLRSQRAVDPPHLIMPMVPRCLHLGSGLSIKGSGFGFSSVGFEV